MGKKDIKKSEKKHLAPPTPAGRKGKKIKRGAKPNQVTNGPIEIAASNLATPLIESDARQGPPESDESFLTFTHSLKDIAEFVTFWNYVKSHSSQHYRQAWPAAGLGNGDKAKGRLDAIAAEFHRGHFFITDGRTRLEVNHDQQLFVQELEALVQKVGRYLTAPRKQPMIRLGVGHSVAISIGPAILKTLREKYIDFEVELVIGDADRLLQHLEKGQLDCLLGILPHPQKEKNVHPSEVNISVGPALIARHGHPIARRFREKKLVRVSEDLFDLPPPKGKWGVHIFESESFRRPRHFVPRWDIVNFLNQPNYAAINELVAGGDDLGITFPEFLTKGQKLALQVMPLQVQDKPRVQLFSCEKVCNDHFNLMNDGTDGKFGKRLDELLAVAKGLVSDQCRIAHKPPEKIQYRVFARIRLPKKQGSENGLDRWAVGTMTSYCIVDDRFSGELVLSGILPEVDGEDETKYKRFFSIYGRTQRIEVDFGWRELVTLQLVDEGIEPFVINGTGQKSSQGELLTASYVRTSSEDHYVGSWHGWNPQTGTQIHGYLLIENPNKKVADDDLTAQFLDDARNGMMKHLRLSLD